MRWVWLRNNSAKFKKQKQPNNACVGEDFPFQNVQDGQLEMPIGHHWTWNTRWTRSWNFTTTWGWIALVLAVALVRKTFAGIFSSNTTDGLIEHFKSTGIYEVVSHSHRWCSWNSALDKSQLFFAELPLCPDTFRSGHKVRFENRRRASSGTAELGSKAENSESTVCTAHKRHRSSAIAQLHHCSGWQLGSEILPWCVQFLGNSMLVSINRYYVGFAMDTFAKLEVEPPIWKIWSSNWIISPNSGENQKYLSCHQLYTLN